MLSDQKLMPYAFLRKGIKSFYTKQNRHSQHSLNIKTLHTLALVNSSARERKMKTTLYWAVYLFTSLYETCFCSLPCLQISDLSLVNTHLINLIQLESSQLLPPPPPPPILQDIFKVACFREWCSLSDVFASGL